MPHVIRNFDTLATTKEREDALAIAEAGYATINTHNAVVRKIHIENEDLVIEGKRYPLQGRRVLFVGVGKCALAGGVALEDILGDHLTAGIALDVSRLEGRTPKKIETYIGTHPEPSDVNLHATERIVEFLEGCGETDLVLMLISGGGSTLLCLHDAPMTCLDERTLFTELTGHGASILDLNMVRKHISKARGGGLARAAYPAEVVSLIVSDVPGDTLEFIASGPTVLDSSSVADAKAVLERYGIQPSVGTEFIETPKDEKYFERVTNTLFLTGKDALEAMQAEAERLGYHVTIRNEHFSGEAREVGHTVASALHVAPPKSVMLYAGESTVALGHTTGSGGRSQELALSALGEVADGEIVLPFASDGRDNTDHAGAIADVSTREHAKAKQLSSAEALESHKSYDFFASTGDFLDTGYTGSNVSDLIITLKN